MNRRIGTLLLVVLFAFAFSLHGKGAEGKVVKIKIDGVIHPIAEEYVSRAIDRAQAERASAILIELQTPGGMMDSMRGITRQD